MVISFCHHPDTIKRTFPDSMCGAAALKAHVGSKCASQLREGKNRMTFCTVTMTLGSTDSVFLNFAFTFVKKNPPILREDLQYTNTLKAS